ISLFLLAKYSNENARNVHAYILGEHSDKEFAVWSNAMIRGTSIKNYCDMCNSINYNDSDKNFEKSLMN
ncbi:MAG: L-lactate dehydrogenase, partial [Candidatus Thorarchaeota archaeon]